MALRYLSFGGGGGLLALPLELGAELLDVATHHVVRLGLQHFLYGLPLLFFCVVVVVVVVVEQTIVTLVVEEMRGEGPKLWLARLCACAAGAVAR